MGFAFALPFIYGPSKLGTSYFLGFTGAVVFLSLGNLKKYGSFLIYDGILRLVISFTIIYYWIFSSYTDRVDHLAAMGDLVFGILYFILVPKGSERSFTSLLLNRDS